MAIAKGPNALLFGLRSPAGLYNNQPQQSSFDEETEIKLRYGSWGAHREIIDANRVLVDDVLSLRIIGLNNQTKYKQKPSFEDGSGYLERYFTSRRIERLYELMRKLELGMRVVTHIITPRSNILIG